MRTSRIELQEVAIRALPTRTDGKHLGVRTRKCQNCPVRENPNGTILGVEREFAALERHREGSFGRRSKVKSVKTSAEGSHFDHETELFL